MAETQRVGILDGWLASIQRGKFANLGRLRHWPGIEVCDAHPELLWIRGARMDCELHQALRHLLSCQLYQLMSDGQLMPMGATLPEGYAPEGPWTSLSQWLTLSLPSKRFAAELVPQVTLKLVRSHQPQPATLLRTPLSDWAAYAETAPAVRLSRLQFAASESQAIILGQPLPPIPGDLFYLRDAIAAPIGYRWSPALDTGVLSQLFELDRDDVVLILDSGQYSLIRCSDWVGATRSAIRLTVEAASEVQ